MEQQEKDTIRISVRNFVEFILRSGSIDNRRRAGAENAMQEGTRIHRMIQKRMASNYHAEISLKHVVETPDFNIWLEGRADGIIIDEISDEIQSGINYSEQIGLPLNQYEYMPIKIIPELENKTSISVTKESAVKVERQVTIDEIKGVYMDLSFLSAPIQVHLAQAKCYAYIYAKQNCLCSIRVRMTYCNIETEEIRYFHEEFTFQELEHWFLSVLNEYMKWALFQHEWKQIRKESIHKLEFPFPYRKGQKELAAQVYRTIYHNKKLFIEAPTGVGKTISTIFPAVKAVGEGRADKIFYLTAKTITGAVAKDAFDLLRSRGLQYKTVILTARDKVCFLEKADCNPLVCPYAKGHFDRVNDALYSLLTTEDSCSRDVILEYARNYQVCPFEMCLDMSLFADAVICDYNYVFDPNVYLKRFFSDGIKGEYLFLIDEAHNLVDRAREMYSAQLYKEDFLELKNLVKPYDGKLAKYLESSNKQMLEWKRECESLMVLESVGAFSMSITRVLTQMEKLMEREEEEINEIRSKVLELYLNIRHFLSMEERIDDSYVIYTEHDADSRFKIKLFCVNPSTNLSACLNKGNSTIFFSATLIPIAYYKELLSTEKENYAVYAESTFDNSQKGIFIGSDVSSKYTRRTELEFYNIASYIHEITSKRMGNYLIFFPSHQFLQQVYEVFQNYFCTDKTECILQQQSMSETEREDFLTRFEGNEDCDLQSLIQMDIEVEEEKYLLGFCVSGGIFAEGIDLKYDSLIGAIIVGTALPQVCNERELLKQYFDEKGFNGFDYAYRYPGMNKVLQAAGRVIRTTEDIGIIALLDERFLTASYLKMFPREWSGYQRCSLKNIGDKVAEFWKKWR